MAKSRMYRKKGRKSMRKGRRKTQRIKRRGGNNPQIDAGHLAYTMSSSYTDPFKH